MFDDLAALLRQRSRPYLFSNSVAPAVVGASIAVFDMLAADNLPFVGYHMPWPAFGYVEKQGDGYRYRPHSYQLLL